MSRTRAGAQGSSPDLAHRLGVELKDLVYDKGGVDLVDAGRAAARARWRGALLVPAMRTAESVLLHLLGATGIDPLAFKMRRWTDPTGVRPPPMWYAGQPVHEVPTTLAWQLVAADRIWPEDRPWSIVDWNHRIAKMVVATWSETRPGSVPPRRMPKSLADLAGMCVLASPLSESVGLRTAYDGPQAIFRPSGHTAFAETRGWPVFADVVLCWIDAVVGECTPGDGEGYLWRLRMREQNAMRWLSPEFASDRELIFAFGPKITPRSVAVAEAMLTVIGARCFVKNRNLTTIIRHEFGGGESSSPTIG